MLFYYDTWPDGLIWWLSELVSQSDASLLRDRFWCPELWRTCFAKKKKKSFGGHDLHSPPPLPLGLADREKNDMFICNKSPLGQQMQGKRNALIFLSLNQFLYRYWQKNRERLKWFCFLNYFKLEFFHRKSKI